MNNRLPNMNKLLYQRKCSSFVTLLQHNSLILSLLNLKAFVPALTQINLEMIATLIFLFILLWLAQCFIWSSKTNGKKIRQIKRYSPKFFLLYGTHWAHYASFVAMFHSLYSVTNEEQHKKLESRSLQKTSKCVSQYYTLRSEVPTMVHLCPLQNITNEQQYQKLDVEKNTGRKHDTAWGKSYCTFANQHLALPAIRTAGQRGQR